MTCPAIWAFLHATIRDLKQQHWHEIPSNLNTSQIKALKSLQKCSDFAIKQSDKGGNIVLMTHTQYQSMFLTILNNPNWYQPISPTLTYTFASEIRDFCTGAFLEGLIDRDTLKFLVPKLPRTPTFYSLPKTHKNVQNPPDRRIVSGIGSLTDNASKFVDAFLVPHVRSLPSYIRDTTDLLKHLKGTQIPPNALLVAIDIEVLYSIIPQDRAVS